MARLSDCTGVLGPTMVGMSREVLHVDDQIVVRVQFPELAVDHVEMLVGEKVSDLKVRG